jgi:hypothetical protein
VPPAARPRGCEFARFGSVWLGLARLGLARAGLDWVLLSPCRLGFDPDGVRICLDGIRIGAASVRMGSVSGAGFGRLGQSWPGPAWLGSARVLEEIFGLILRRIDRTVSDDDICIYIY